MNRKRFLLPLLIGLVITLLLPGSALAAKRIYKARIQGSGNISGSSLLGTNINGSGLNVQVFARNVGGGVDEVWLTNGTHELALCGVEGAAEAVCSHDSSGNLDFESTITSGLLAYWNWPGSQLISALDGGSVEIEIVDNSVEIASGTYSRIYP